MEKMNHEKGRWVIQAIGDSRSRSYSATKIVLATGYTSRPSLPSYPGADCFEGIYCHSRDFGLHIEDIAPSDNVVVVGGAKSAMDVAYACVEKGASVDLLIRPNGGRAVLLTHVKTQAGKRLEDLPNVRWRTWFSPCTWGAADGFGWIRGFLHSTWLGRCVTGYYWRRLESQALAADHHSSHQEVRKLRPQFPLFWLSANGVGIHNYDTNIYDLVKEGKIRVHLTEIESLEQYAVCLQDGTRLRTNAVICATGWEKWPDIHISGVEESVSARTPERHVPVDEQILGRYPVLQDASTLR